MLAGLGGTLGGAIGDISGDSMGIGAGSVTTGVIGGVATGHCINSVTGAGLAGLLAEARNRDSGDAERKRFKADRRLGRRGVLAWSALVVLAVLYSLVALVMLAASDSADEAWRERSCAGGDVAAIGRVKPVRLVENTDAAGFMGGPVSVKNGLHRSDWRWVAHCGIQFRRIVTYRGSISVLRRCLWSPPTSRASTLFGSCLIMPPR